MTDNESKTYDVIIIGSGPAAYEAALYLKEYEHLLIEGGMIGANGPGGQLTTTTNVDNYPGIVHINGPDLVNQMFLHVKPNVVSETADYLAKNGNYLEVRTEVSIYKSKSAIIATGAIARRLLVEGTGDNELWMKGISACAVCDGWFYKDRICCVIGGGDSAMEETQYLAGIASKVYLIHRRKEFRARPDFLSKIKKFKNVEILTPFSLKKASGKEELESITLVNTETGAEEIKKVDGMFFGIGHDPNTKFCKGIDLTEDNYIIVNKKMETNLEGVFASGDVQDKKFKQANTAAASGCVAALTCIEYLKRNGILPK